MTSKEYLKTFRDLGLRIQSLREEIAAVEGERDSVTVSMDGMPGSGKIGDKTGEVAARLADKLTEMKEDLSDLTYTYWNRRQVIVKQIDSLDDAVSARILMLRYVNGYTWEQIAVEMNYSYVHTCRLHGYALQQFYKRYQDVIECYTK